MTSNKINTEYLFSPHFKFKAIKTLRYSRTNEPFTLHYLVGSKSKPCVSLFFYLPSAESIIGSNLLQIANLNNIEALYSCIENEISQDEFEKYSFGQELMNTILLHLQKFYPYITKLKINDASYIPCNRESKDNLDLLTYSIAHYGKTWYERYYNAFLPSTMRQTQYQSEINAFISHEFKSNISWEEFLNVYVMSSSDYTNDFINNNYDILEELYNNSLTFPDFFKQLTAQIPKQKKCIFYKYWLEQFIGKYVHFDRDWIIPIRTKKGGKRLFATRNKTKKIRPEALGKYP